MPWWTLGVFLTTWSIGVMLAVLLSPLWPWLAMAAVVSLVTAALYRQIALVAALALVALVLGAGRGAIAVKPALPSTIVGQNVLVTGRVDDDPVERKATRRLTVHVDRVLTDGGPTARDLRIQATIYGLTPVHYGDLVLLAGDLEQPPRFEQFDYRAYLAEQGIAGVMPSARLIRVTAHPGDPFHTGLFAVRRALIGAVDRALPEPQAALILGVVFGYRAALPPVLQQQMIASGLIHIVVISGLKVSLLARIVHHALGRWLPRAAPMIAVAVMAGYALLAGASAAALRASAMGMLIVLAGRLRRDSHVFVSLALTAAVMLGLKPSLAQDVSFQLSFAGTIGIASMTDRIAAFLKWMPGPIRDAFSATCAAELATWPLMLANFHQVSIVGPAANAFVLPLLPVIMVIGGGGALLGSVAAGIGWPLLQLAGMIASWFRIVIETLGSSPVAAVVTPYFSPRWLVAAAILNGGALAGVKLRQFFWQRRVWAVLGLAGTVAVAVLLVQPDGRVHVYALDVGTGSAILVRTANGHQILIDVGPDSDRFVQAIGRALPPTTRKIDIWLITGGRRENIGAAAAVLNRFRIGTIMVNDADAWSVTLRSLVQQARGEGVSVAAASGTFEVDGVSLSRAVDGRSWLIEAGSSRVAVVPAETSWRSLPADVDGVIFTSGGPPEWQGPSHGFTVIQVAAHSGEGLPMRSVRPGLADAPVLRTDRLGTVQLVSTGAQFTIASGD